ncbi:protein nuclear fusion defective 4 [Quercus suber]|uniref:Protein nuclear fusion defective 4 n=1 Tax=Quercus suber TaxID=58331 RepID=A0AAW0M608_QUESU
MLDTVSVFKDIGANAGVLSGLLYSSATIANHRRRTGLWLVHLAGAVQCFLGYFLMWASVVGLIPRPPMAAMCLFMLVAANAQSFFNTANVVTGVRNFPNYSGTILESKWVSTIASIWIQCTSGSLYTFSIYSVLKLTQAYDQSMLDTVSVFKDIGANAGVLSGLLYSSATIANHRRRTGLWLVHLAGAVQCFLGYFLMWASVVGLIPRPPMAAMCLFMLVAANAQSFFNTANVVTGVRNFPNYSGTIGFLGLSRAILIQVYETIFTNKPTSYLLMLALLPTINTLLLMWCVRINNTNEGDEKKHLDSFSLIALVIAAYLMAIIILEHILFFQFTIRVTAFVLLMLLLASPICIAIRAHQRDSDRISLTLAIERDQLTDDPNQLVAEKI